MVLFLLFLAAFATLLPAQTDQARLSGTVKDASGAVIPAAKVTVHNEKTGAERAADANAQGYYVMTTLSAARYTVSPHGSPISLDSSLSED
jgi:hypothetical protein